MWVVTDMVGVGTYFVGWKENFAAGRRERGAPVWTGEWSRGALFRDRRNAEALAFEVAAKLGRVGVVGVAEIKRWVLVTTTGFVAKDGVGMPDPAAKRLFLREHHQLFSQEQEVVAAFNNLCWASWVWGWQNASLFHAPQDAGFLLSESNKAFPALRNRIEVADLDRVYGL